MMSRTAAIVVLLGFVAAQQACRSDSAMEMQPANLQQMVATAEAARRASAPVVDPTVPATAAGLPLRSQTIGELARCRRNVAVTAIALFNDGNVDFVTTLRASPNRDRVVLGLKNSPKGTDAVVAISVTEPSLFDATDEAWHESVTQEFAQRLVRVVGGRSLELVVRGAPSDVATLVATFQSTLDANCVARATAQ
jgi:hypothetical protein